MRTLSKMLVAIYAGMVLLAGCSASSASLTRLGTDTFPPLPESADVFVFAREADIGTAFLPVGMVQWSRENTWVGPTLDDAMPALKHKAREAGANGLTLEGTSVMGSLGRGLIVRARAVRIPDKLPK